MRDKFESLVFGVLSGIISYYLAPALPAAPTPFNFLQYANHPGVRFVVFLLILWYVLSSIVDWVRKRSRRRVAVASVSSRACDIRYTRWEGVVHHFGVDWDAKYGSPGYSDDYIGVAEGPYCPECGSELMDGDESRFIRQDKPIWKCPGCPFTTARPKRFLYEEREAVGNVIEREIEVEENRMSDLETDDNEEGGG